MSLGSAIVQSLRQHEMVSELPAALLNTNRTQVLQHDETEYWDYKVDLSLGNPVEVARLARHVLAFHNGKGGLIVVGVRDDFRVVGVPQSRVVDSKILRDKLRRYTGPGLKLFTNQIQLTTPKVLWLLFVPGREEAPIAVAVNGPRGKNGKLVLARNQYYVRVQAESKLCVEPDDYERLFGGFSLEHLQAYLYDVDEPYYRLLAPRCEQFVGRKKLLSKVARALETRHPLVALDGVGGVGKTEVAIQLVRELYEANRYMFILSTSAKNRVWHGGKVGSRRAGFSGLTELLQEFARVLGLKASEDVEVLKRRVIREVSGIEGLLLVDNLESIEDPTVFEFLSREVPDPVKVLVTSRVDKGLGALTESVPQLEASEAEELLSFELRRVGVSSLLQEEEQLSAILRVTAGLPLAIKWAAALASSLGSLREVSSRLRKTDTSKREFLNFCFATMFEELSPLAKQVALLCPYLGERWSVATVSLALQQRHEDVEDAVNQLKSYGILLASERGGDTAVRMLPLTTDFLAQEWNANRNLRKVVNARLSDAAGRSGRLLDLSPEQQGQALLSRAEEMRVAGDFEQAGRLVRVALEVSRDPRAMFLEGRIRYEAGRVREGLGRMRVALAQLRETESSAEEDVVFAEALLSHGESEDEREALVTLSRALPRTKTVRRETIDSFFRRSFEVNDWLPVRDYLGRVEVSQARQAYWIAQNVRDAVSDQSFVHWCGMPLAKLLAAVAEGGHCDEDERVFFEEKAKSVREMIKADSGR